MHTKSAYLIVICDPHTHAIANATIWSSPEWEQSRCLAEYAYVAYAVSGDTYEHAKDCLLEAISDERSRYHHLYKLIIKQQNEERLRTILQRVKCAQEGFHPTNPQYEDIARIINCAAKLVDRLYDRSSYGQELFSLRKAIEAVVDL